MNAELEAELFVLHFAEGCLRSHQVATAHDSGLLCLYSACLTLPILLAARYGKSHSPIRALSHRQFAPEWQR